MNTQAPLRVGVHISPPVVIKKSDGTYEGVLYDMWTKIKEKLNVPVEEIFVEHKDINEDVVGMGKHEKYDMIVGPISVTEYRIKHVNYTRPLILNRIKIGYIPKTSFEEKFITLLGKNLLLPLLSLIVLGIICGFALYAVEPSRGRGRAIMSSIASMFGEMGYVSENAKLRPLGLFVVFCILLLSYYTSIYLQAYTVDKYLHISDSMELNKDNVKGCRLVTTKGSLYVKMFQDQYNCEMFERTSKQDVVDTYRKNTNLYDGFVLDYQILKYFSQKYPNLTISDETFSNDELAFPILKRHNHILHRINEIIVDMQDSQETKKICRKYIDVEDADNCEF